ncbi:hypothetical protein DL767_004568 [Monosporascus sp. MG133]|nr:hypothetical protein DL767_004568 [Monosporascus sp. MG133]
MNAIRFPVEVDAVRPPVELGEPTNGLDEGLLWYVSSNTGPTSVRAVSACAAVRNGGPDSSCTRRRDQAADSTVAEPLALPSMKARSRAESCVRGAPSRRSYASAKPSSPWGLAGAVEVFEADDVPVRAEAQGRQRDSGARAAIRQVPVVGYVDRLGKVLDSRVWPWCGLIILSQEEPPC